MTLLDMINNETDEILAQLHWHDFVCLVCEEFIHKHKSFITFEF